jgi:hypothetical protein
MRNILVTETRRIEITFVDDTLTVIDALDYDWWYEFFRVFTYVSMDHFDRDNIKEIVVDGDPIDLPS